MSNLKILRERKLLDILFYLGYMLKVRIRSIAQRKILEVLKYFENRIGIEVGGPSPIFKKGGQIPIYKVADQIDNVNFSKKTIWTGDVEVSEGYVVGGKHLGHHLILDATDLSSLQEQKYDFVISSHSLEHIANPIKALKQFYRILKPEGVVLIVVPRKEANFDHRREVAKFDDLVNKYQNDIGEDDLSSLDEILRLHDLRLDLTAGSAHHFKLRSLKNRENRSLHQHVYDQSILRRILKFSGFRIVKYYANYSENIVLARKVGQ